MKLQPGRSRVEVRIGDGESTQVFTGILREASRSADYPGDAGTMEVSIMLDGNRLAQSVRKASRMTRAEFVEGLINEAADAREEQDMAFKAHVDFDKRRKAWHISIEDEDGKFLTSLDGKGERIERQMGEEMPVVTTIPDELFSPIMYAARGVEGAPR